MTHNDLDALLERLDGIGTWECKIWRNKLFHRSPVLAWLLVPVYLRIAEADDHVAANSWLRELQPRIRIGKLPLTVGSDDEAIQQVSKTLVRSMRREIWPALARGQARSAFTMLQTALEGTGVAVGINDSDDEEKIAARLKRFCEEDWWFRQLRKIQRMGYEAIARELGHVQVRRNLYVSDLGLHRFLDQKRRNRALLEQLEAENEEGKTYTLAELQDISPANPIIRYGELMVRIRGFEEYAMAQPVPHVGLFITLTCPSKYHAFKKSGQMNTNYKGSTPRQANEYLNTVWQRTRAAWARDGIQPFGFRVVEPHHDGTPHWHILLFVPQSQGEKLLETFRFHALQEDGDEPGADKRRFVAEEMDHSKGSAAGYIAKYIAKNINGAGLETDTYGFDAVQSAFRIRAWVSIWGIHQFEQIGGPSVTVYREMRRLGESAELGEEFEAIRRAADTADWPTFTERMGGTTCKRKDRPLAPYREAGGALSRYGEKVLRIRGVLYMGLPILTRFHTWIIKLKVVDIPQAAQCGYRDLLCGLVPESPGSNSLTLEYCQ